MAIFQIRARLASAFTGSLLLAMCLVLAACDTAVHVDATADVPVRYSRVLVTVEEVWFNESAEAVPSDTTWHKFRLDDSVTLNLISLTGGQLATIASALEVPAGTYRQVRLLLASRDAKLRDSADDLGADHNNEVTWFDEDGKQGTEPLEVLNADQGIGMEIDLEVEEGTVGGATVQILFNAARDLTEFRYAGRTGFLLNPTLKAFDVEDAGTIRGVLNLSQLLIQTPTGRPDIQVTAQALDGLGRRVIVGSAFVTRAGSFILCPLPFDEDEDTEYDLVISGPGIQTIVIQEVPVSEGAPDTATPLALGALSLAPADSFEADVQEDAPVVPRGAHVGFFQTLPGENEPYIIGTAAVDPVAGRLSQPVILSRASTLMFGTYRANLTLRSSTPQEGSARYAVAALSPHFERSAFSDTLLRPASRVSDTALFSVPVPGLPAGAVAGTLSVTVTVENPGRYDSGVLLVTREGAVVTMAPLDAMLQQSLGSTFVDVSDVPAGSATTTFPRGLYQLEAWVWRSADPRGTFTRHRGAEAVDVRTSAAASGAVTIR